MLVLNRIPAVPTFAQMHREMNQLLNAFAPRVSAASSGYAPAMNVWQNETGYFIEAELPGFKMEDIDISVLGDQVTIKARRRAPKIENATYLRTERHHGEFTRTFTLPGPVQVDKVEASLIDGVLTVTLPKTPEVQPRKITVKVGT
jgi:HSP20 family protein